MTTIYLATPMTMYRDPGYAAFRKAVRAKFGAARYVEPALLGWSVRQFLREWPKVLRRLDAVCVFPQRNGIIGRGVLREITDAARHSIPVYCFSRGSWRPSAKVQVRTRTGWSRPIAIGRVTRASAAYALSGAYYGWARAGRIVLR